MRPFHAASIFNHADNLISRRAGNVALESLSERLFARPITLGQRFVDNRDRPLVPRLLVAENTSLQQGDAQRLKIIWRHCIEVRLSLLLAAFGKKQYVTFTGIWRELSQANRFHAGQRFQSLDELAVE